MNEEKEAVDYEFHLVVPKERIKIIADTNVFKETIETLFECISKRTFTISIDQPTIERFLF